MSDKDFQRSLWTHLDYSFNKWFPVWWVGKGGVEDPNRGTVGWQDMLWGIWWLGQLLRAFWRENLRKSKEKENKRNSKVGMRWWTGLMNGLDYCSVTDLTVGREGIWRAVSIGRTKTWEEETRGWYSAFLKKMESNTSGTRMINSNHLLLHSFAIKLPFGLLLFFLSFKQHWKWTVSSIKWLWEQGCKHTSATSFHLQSFHSGSYLLHLELLLPSSSDRPYCPCGWWRVRILLVPPQCSYCDLYFWNLLLLWCNLMTIHFFNSRRASHEDFFTMLCILLHFRRLSPCNPTVNNWTCKLQMIKVIPSALVLIFIFIAFICKDTIYQ